MPASQSHPTRPSSLSRALPASVSSSTRLRCTARLHRAQLTTAMSGCHPPHARTARCTLAACALARPHRATTACRRQLCRPAQDCVPPLATHPHRVTHAYAWPRDVGPITMGHGTDRQQDEGRGCVGQVGHDSGMALTSEADPGATSGALLRRRTRHLTTPPAATCAAAAVPSHCTACMARGPGTPLLLKPAGGGTKVTHVPRAAAWLSSSEALAVHNAGAALVVLALGDPHLREGRCGSGAGGDERAVGAHWLHTAGGGAQGPAGRTLLTAWCQRARCAAPACRGVWALHTRGVGRRTCWKVDRLARMEPPIQTLYLRSGGATTLTFIALGASAVISLDMRSAMPGNMVVPPDSTMLEYRSLRMSTSHFMMLLKVVSWMPLASMPTMDGLNSTSGQRKRSLPMVITWRGGGAAHGICSPGGGGHLHRPRARWRTAGADRPHCQHSSAGRAQLVAANVPHGAAA